MTTRRKTIRSSFWLRRNKGNMQFLKRYKKLNLWLLANLGALAAYFLCRGNRAWMNALTEGFTTP